MFLERNVAIQAMKLTTTIIAQCKNAARKPQKHQTKSPISERSKSRHRQPNRPHIPSQRLQFQRARFLPETIGGEAHLSAPPPVARSIGRFAGGGNRFFDKNAALKVTHRKSGFSTDLRRSDGPAQQCQTAQTDQDDGQHPQRYRQGLIMRQEPRGLRGHGRH